MPEKRANLLLEFRADNVLEFAGVRVGFGADDGECVGEKPLGKPVAADHIARAILAGRSRLTSFRPTTTSPRSDRRLTTRIGSLTPSDRTRSSSAGMPSSPQIQTCSRR